MTLLKGVNMDAVSCDGYAELFRLSDCDFIEAKGGTWTNNMENEGLSSENLPMHEDVCDFARRLAAALPEYGVASTHAHSCAVLLARRDRFLEPTGRWRTWIDFDRFAEAATKGETLEVQDFALDTPDWALAPEGEDFFSFNGGFDPAEERRRRRSAPQWREREPAAGGVAESAVLH
mmetsp:Transcript_145647/g.451696  ORF Transcript_145647/g.451696 Transcript_145647/m.451696 type:complete len:177 (+) Transcript_145647:162-692(+)